MYVYALFVVRMLGRRGMGQLPPFDFVIIIALGSAVGDPMFYHDVPVLHALVAITAIVLFTRGLVFLTQRNRHLKQFLSTSSTRLVKDGVIGSRSYGLGGHIPKALRGEDVEQLGQVSGCIWSQVGRVTAFQYEAGDVIPGIPLIPDADIDRPRPPC